MVSASGPAVCQQLPVADIQMAAPLCNLPHGLREQLGHCGQSVSGMARSALRHLTAIYPYSFLQTVVCKGLLATICSFSRTFSGYFRAELDIQPVLRAQQLINTW